MWLQMRVGRKIIVGLLFFLVTVGLLGSGRIVEGESLQESATFVGPGVYEALERQEQVRVLVGLREPDVPLAERTTDLRRKNTAARAAEALGSLTESDFTLEKQFEISAALSGSVTQTGIEKLARHPAVVSVGLTCCGTIQLGQSVPLIKADLIHTLGWDGTGVKVAVLDTGIDSNHLDLSGSIIGEKCFLSVQGAPCGPSGHRAEDDHGHGTRVSSVITSNGNVASVGVAPGAGIYAYKIADSNGELEWDDVLEALDDIEDRGFQEDFVNMSIGDNQNHSPGNCRNDLGPVKSQLSQLLFFGDIVTFAATGNNGFKSGMNFPACDGSVVSVGAVYDASVGAYPWQACTDGTTAADKVACASNSSPDLDLLAPGCKITMSTIGGGTATFCGTSYASPHAVGVAALMLDAQPGLTASQIKALLKKTGKWVYDDLAQRWTPRVDARVTALGSDGSDSDGDGCANGFELDHSIDAESMGGLRNPVDPNDYYDVLGPGQSLTRDGVIDLPNDILAVIQHFSPTGGPPYDVRFDRGPSSGPNFWNMTAPDEVIDLPNDVLGVILQFQHNCQ